MITNLQVDGVTKVELRLLFAVDIATTGDGLSHSFSGSDVRCSILCALTGNPNREVSFDTPHDFGVWKL